MNNSKNIFWSRSLFAILLLVSILFGLLFSKAFVVTATESEAIKPEHGNYYTSDYDTKREALDAGNAFNEEIYGEGAVLLKNEDNALPLARGSKISLFGKNSAGLLNGGSGAGGGTGLTPRTIQESLLGAGFQLNPELVKFYNNDKASGSGRGAEPLNPDITSGYNTGETPVELYTDELEQSYGLYNDAALVVISRISGEGFDLPRTMMWNGESYRTWSDKEVVPGARSKTDHYLQLDQNEAELIKYVGSHFNKVVVLLNTGSTFETGFLDDTNHYAYHPNVKGALWIGYGGTTGIMSLGKLLNGEINPSGKTTDIWSRDFKQDPSYMNFGNNNVANGNHYANSGWDWPYVYYKEGIYIGYRYYETRGFTEGTQAYVLPDESTLSGQTTTKEWDSWYAAHIVYPFGYGLSYTSFKWELTDKQPAENSILTADETITVQVKVTNTGNVSGKDIVQLYYTAPYYEGEIEKAHVVLGAFGKTELLEPGESETLSLKIKVRDMASYDWSDANRNGFKGYELDQGRYTVKLMRDSHNPEFSIDYTVPASDDGNTGFRYTTSETGGKIENRFDDVSNEIDTYLSRSDWEGTFPTTELKITADEWIKEKAMEWYGTHIEDNPDQPYYVTDMPITGNDTPSKGVVLADLVGLDYDDPKWELFLDELSVKTMQNIVGPASHASGVNVPALGITRVTNADGPAGFHYMTPGPNAFYCSETMLAATWNTDLAYRKGYMLGNEGLHGTDGQPYSKYAGIYAPGVNIHRSPFGGRNYEYYSEDGFLTGKMAAQLVAGAREKGLFCYVKHFALNDQETDRVGSTGNSGYGLITWANEQAMREIYFKGFELCVTEGKTTAIMSACNRIGAVWSGGSYELLTEVLRNEWGFQGTVVTDAGLHPYMNSDQSLRAGGDTMLSAGAPSYNISSATTVAGLRRVAHDYLYTHANSMAMNTAASAAPLRLLNIYEGSTLPLATVDMEYTASVATATVNKELVPDGNDSDIKYSIKPGDGLPVGLTLSSDGSITGKPQKEANNHTFTVIATYRDFSREAKFIINVVGGNGAIVFSGESDLGILSVGKPAEKSVALAKIVTPDIKDEDQASLPKITYSLKNGSLLPEGLTFTQDGMIKGTPTKVCEDYEFTVEAFAIGFSAQEMTFTISVFNDLTFTSSELAGGKYGVKYIDRIVPAESKSNVTYELTEDSSLPKGLIFTEEGYIIGTPTVAVTDHKFTVRALADYCVAQEAEFSITIGISYNNFVMPDGMAGEAYSASVGFAQGVTGIKYSLKEGCLLPEGLSLSEDGMLTGTPSKAGVYSLTFTANADGYEGDEFSFDLYIANANAAGSGCNAGICGIVPIPVILLLFAVAAIKIVYRRNAHNSQCK